MTLNLANTKTLIFDLDGTISDPFEGIFRSINYALESCGFEVVDAECVRPMIGPPLTEIFACLVGTSNARRIGELIDKYRERYATRGYAENVIYEDIPATISSLTEKGYTLGVCTSKRADYAAAIIDLFNLATHFEFLSGGGDGVEKSQQLRSLITNGLEAKTALMIGDRRFDIDAAKSNGIASIGVSWGFATFDELAVAGADHIVDSPAELLRMLT